MGCRGKPPLVATVMAAMVVELLLVLEAGDKRDPNVEVRNALKVLNLVKVNSCATRDILVVELFSTVNTAAWYQEPPSLHIIGPPESP